MFAVAVATILGVAFLVSWLTGPKFTEDEPPLISSVVPWVGKALHFAWSKTGLFYTGHKRFNQNPFSYFMAGRKHYIFWKNYDVAQIYRQSKVLSSKNFVILIHRNLFGMTKSEALEYDHAMEGLQAAARTYLLRDEHADALARTFFVDLNESFDKLDEEIRAAGGKKNFALLPLVWNIQGKASTRAYYGKRLLEINPNILQDLYLYIRNGWWPFLLGFPKLLIPSSSWNARERMINALNQYVFEDPADDVSGFVKSKLRAEYGKGAMAKDFLGFLFGLNGNSGPTAFCALLRLVADPQLAATLRKEACDVGLPKLDPRDWHKVIPDKVPHFRAMWLESLRMHAATMNIREVLEPTTLEADRTWKLEKGAICTIPSVLLHRNPDIHPHPEEFRIQRFLPTELGGDGSDPKKGLRPFGGGASYCPGRIFAEKQIMSTLANFVMRYEMRITDKKWKYPANADPETVVAHPDIHIEISLRKDWIRN